MQKILFEDFYEKKESYLYDEGDPENKNTTREGEELREGSSLSDYSGSLEGMTIFEEYELAEGKNTREGVSLEGGFNSDIFPEIIKDSPIQTAGMVEGVQKPNKNTLREGIILSEILGSPRARRRYSFFGKYR